MMHPIPPAYRPPLLIGLPAERALDDGMAFDRVGLHYVQALARAADAVGGPHPVAPLMLPTHADAAQLAVLLSLVDGVLLPGSPTNVDPERYGQTAEPHDGPFDRERDALTHTLVRHAVAQGLPMLAICRGLQEANVALGGTLRREVQDLPGMLDHREPPQAPDAEAFAPSHRVRLRDGGALAGWAGASTAMVNSLHRQGVDRLGPGARAEAWSEDGLVESFSLPDAPGFFVAVQWHPEAALALALPDAPAMDTRLFDAFMRACIAYRAARPSETPAPGARPS